MLAISTYWLEQSIKCNIKPPSSYFFLNPTITRAKNNTFGNKKYTILYKQVESKLQGAQTCTERFCQHCVTHTDPLSRT